MKEIACQFGENQRLSGIMTLSEPFNSNQAIVFLDPGFESKYGPYRLHVNIARLAARLSFNSFRFDYGDLGYSQPGKSMDTLKVRKNIEIKAALDYVQENFNINQFILFALCSAAEDSFYYAELDERVRGIICIDTFAYATKRNFVEACLSRLQGGALRRLNKLFKPYPIHPDSEDEASFIQYQYMQQAEAQKIMHKLIQRNVKFHFIYTGGRFFSHKGQLRKMFPELKHYFSVALDFLHNIGHTQMLEEERVLLLKTIEKRLNKFFQ